MKKQYAFIGALALGLNLLQTATAQDWSIAGNSNVTPSSKLGTTNNISLRFYTNNAQRMIIHSPSGHVGIGTPSPLQRLDVNGNINLAKGFGLYMENHRVLRVDSINSNVFLGNGVGVNNTGYANTATGAFALAANTTAYSNTATGYWALRNNTAGSGNVATGAFALYSNISGYSNVATGYSALSNNTTGSYNVASGQNALFLNTTGSHNTAGGTSALSRNTTGHFNTALGYESLYGNVTGGENTALGYRTLDGTAGSWGNTAVGAYAGYSSRHGWNNTFIGSYATGHDGGVYNSIALGNHAYVTGSNQVRIGNSYTTSIGGYANWTNISDGRVKRNVKENVPGLAFINKLKPVTYTLDLDAADKLMGVADRKDKDGKTIATQLSPADLAARTAKQKVVYTGFVAQDVEKAAKELNYEFSGVDAAKNEKDLYGLRYNEFIMPLVKAVQELSKENKTAKEETRQLKEQVKEQQQQIEALRRLFPGQNKEAQHDPAFGSGYLKQNTPNPAYNSTRISYTLPAHTGHAQLLLLDANGRILRTLALSGPGFTDLNTADLSSGVYTYSLQVDGQLVETRKMEVIHR